MKKLVCLVLCAAMLCALAAVPAPQKVSVEDDIIQICDPIFDDEDEDYIPTSINTLL